MAYDARLFFLWRLVCLNMISSLQVVHVATVTQVTKMTTKDKADTTECNPCSYQYIYAIQFETCTLAASMGLRS